MMDPQQQQPQSSRGNGRTKPDELQDDIHRTRANIDESLHAIEDKLTPGELLSEALRFVSGGDGKSSAATRLLSGIARTVKQHPIPAALIGVGLVTLIDSGGSDKSGVGQGGRGSPDLKKSDSNGHAKAKSGDESEQEHEGKLAHAAGQAADKIGSMASHAKDSIGHGYEKVRHRLEEDPVILGALGVALGAALGAALPRTRAEDETFGDKRDQLVEKAKEIGEEIRDDAKTVARELADAALGEHSSTTTAQA